MKYENGYCIEILEDEKRRGYISAVNFGLSDTSTSIENFRHRSKIYRSLNNAEHDCSILNNIFKSDFKFKVKRFKGIVLSNQTEHSLKLL